MKQVREQTKAKFEEMRLRALREIRSKDEPNRMGQMGALKSFGELADSLLKLRENFDVAIGKKHQDLLMSPLKKKDLMEDYGSNIIGGGSLKEQECETDEEEFDLNKIKPTSTVTTNSFTLQ
jgi:hypothetical protein